MSNRVACLPYRLFLVYYDAPVPRFQGRPDLHCWQEVGRARCKPCSSWLFRIWPWWWFRRPVRYLWPVTGIFRFAVHCVMGSSCLVRKARWILLQEIGFFVIFCLVRVVLKFHCWLVLNSSATNGEQCKGGLSLRQALYVLCMKFFWGQGIPSTLSRPKLYSWVTAYWNRFSVGIYKQWLAKRVIPS